MGMEWMYSKVWYSRNSAKVPRSTIMSYYYYELRNVSQDTFETSEKGVFKKLVPAPKLS